MSEAKRVSWETDEKDHYALYQNIKIKEGNVTVCTLWIDDAPCREFNAAQYKRASLIAAAPDLLAALKSIAIAMEDEVLVHDDQREAMRAATAAIAKATGETP